MIACSTLSDNGGKRKIGASEEKNQWGLGMEGFQFFRSPLLSESLEQATLMIENLHIYITFRCLQNEDLRPKT